MNILVLLFTLTHSWESSVCVAHMEVWIEAMSSFGLKYSQDNKDKSLLPEIIPG